MKMLWERMGTTWGFKEPEVAITEFWLKECCMSSANELMEFTLMNTVGSSAVKAVGSLWLPSVMRAVEVLRGKGCKGPLHSRPLETMVAPSAWLILAAPALFLYFNLSPDISTIPVTQQSFV